MKSWEKLNEMNLSNEEIILGSLATIPLVIGLVIFGLAYAFPEGSDALFLVGVSGILWLCVATVLNLLGWIAFIVYLFTELRAKKRPKFFVFKVLAVFVALGVTIPVAVFCLEKGTSLVIPTSSSD